MMAEDGSESSETGQAVDHTQSMSGDEIESSVEDSDLTEDKFGLSDTIKKEDDASETLVASEETMNGSEDMAKIVDPENERLDDATPEKITAVEPTLDPSDEDLIKEADAWFGVQCYFKAAKCLKRIREQSKLSTAHHQILAVADRAQVTMQECMIPPNDAVLEQNGWIKQTEVHRSHYEHTTIHYKINYKDYSLVSRIESVIESKLLLPLIAVLNESEMYASWMPQYTFPFRMGVTESVKLGEYGRGNQIISVSVKLPYPISNRQVIQHAIAIDSIDDDNAIMIKLNTLDPGTYYENTVVDEPTKGVKRIDLDAGFLIRACPSDHPLLIHRNTHKKNTNEYNASRNDAKSMPLTTDEHEKGSDLHVPKDDEDPSSDTVDEPGEIDDVVDVDVNDSNDTIIPAKDISACDDAKRLDPEGPLLLITLVMQVDAHVTFAPVRLVNFLTRTALAGQWHSLLAVAEEVRTGKRPNIQQSMVEKEELYGWVEQRVDVMLENLRREEEIKFAQQHQTEENGDVAEYFNAEEDI